MSVAKTGVANATIKESRIFSLSAARAPAFFEKEKLFFFAKKNQKIFILLPNTGNIMRRILLGLNAAPRDTSCHRKRSCKAIGQGHGSPTYITDDTTTLLIAARNI